jgi:hypothetical protein
MDIRIPDDVARGLEHLASAQNQSVESWTLDHLRSLVSPQTSPTALLAALRSLPHPSSSAVDELEAAIAASQLPVREQDVFQE